MIKKIFLLLAMALILIFAFLGGVFSVSLNPFSITIKKPEKDILKRVVKKAESIIYREATIHNPPGDMLPDQIDDKIKQEIKDRVN